MIPDISSARDGRLKMRLKCEAVAAKYFGQVAQLGNAIHRARRSLTGRAYIMAPKLNGGLRVIEAPRPITRRSLYVFLHECAHHLLGHLEDRKPKHVHESEAEQWAHQAMRSEGLAVPRKETQRAKRYVALKIRRALKRGAKSIDRDAARFASVKCPDPSQK